MKEQYKLLLSGTFFALGFGFGISYISPSMLPEFINSAKSKINCEYLNKVKKMIKA